MRTRVFLSSKSLALDARQESILRLALGLSLFVSALFFACAFLSLLFFPDGVGHWTGQCGEFVAERYFNHGLGLAMFVLIIYSLQLSARIFARQPLRPFLKKLPLYAVTAVMIAVNLNVVAFYYKMDCAEIWLGGKELYDATVSLTLDNKAFDFLLAIADIGLMAYWVFRNFPKRNLGANPLENE